MSKHQSSKRHSFIEPLESRQLLHGHGGDFGGDFGGSLARLNGAVEFDQAPAAVQTGLATLAGNDGLTAPASDSTQSVSLGNSNGVETYTIVIRGTGTVSRLTVDQNGNPVTAPTRTTATFGTLDSGVSDELNAIATALSLTAATSTTNVSVSTPADGSAASYTVRLARSSGHGRAIAITVDANGNPVGNQSIPFSAMPSTIQNGLNDNAPSGATKLDTTSTQRVSVQTIDGVVLYTVAFTSSGTSTRVTVNAAGAVAALPSHTTADFSTIPEAAQSALQTLATDKGSTDTISATQTTRVSTEANGTVVYTVTVSVTTTDSNGNTHTRNISLSVDASGNATVPSSDDGFGGFFAGGAGGGFGGGFGGGRF